MERNSRPQPSHARTGGSRGVQVAHGAIDCRRRSKINRKKKTRAWCCGRGSPAAEGVRGCWLRPRTRAIFSAHIVSSRALLVPCGRLDSTHSLMGVPAGVVAAWVGSCYSSRTISFFLCLETKYFAGHVDVKVSLPILEKRYTLLLGSTSSGRSNTPLGADRTIFGAR